MPTQTNCAKCNAALDGTAEFCPECGTKVEATPEPARTAGFCPECGAKTVAESAFCPECGKPLGDEKAPGTPEIPITKKSVFKVKPLYIGIAAAALAVIIAVVAIIAGGGGSAGGNYLIYAKDRELQFSYLSKLKPFELTGRLVDGSYTPDADDLAEISAYILMSDNGRYIFYPDRAGDNGFTYYWRDLKADNSKDEAAVRIDSEISGTPYLTGDGDKLFYIKGDDRRLYVFDRKSGEKNKLADDTRDYYVNKAGDYLIYSVYADGEYTVYEMSLKGLTGERNKIDSNSDIYAAFANDKKVYYLKEDTFYLKEYGKDKVRIVSDVDQVVSVVDGKSVYYLKTEEVTNKLSAFITDDLADSDRNLIEPEYPEYPDAPVYPREEDYQERVWYDSYWGSERHPETGEWGYWSYETDYTAYGAALEQYQSAYSVWEAEYNRLWDEYAAAVALYGSKAARDELRTALADEENDVTYDKYNLYYWTQAGETLVASDLAAAGYRYYLASSSGIPAVVYQKYSASATGNQKLSELLPESGSYFYVNDVIWDMRNRIAATRNISGDIYVASGEKENVLDCDNARGWAISQNGTLYFLDDYNDEKGYGVLMSASVSGGTVAKPVKIDEDVMSFRFGNNNANIYYFKDVKDGTGDLYLNGKTLATDVYTSSLYNYAGGDTLLYYIDYSDRNQNGTLCILKGGSQTKIYDDVSFFVPVDEKNVAILTDYNRSRERGDLMLYNGGSKPVLVDADVTALLWSSGMMWGNYIYYSWDY